MADASIDIVLSVRADAGAEQAVKKTLADIKRVAESEGRTIGQTTTKGIVEGFGVVEQHAARTFKKIGVSASRENLAQRMVEGSTTAFQKMSREYEQAVRMMRRETDVFAKAGIDSPQQIKAQIDALKQARAAWEQVGRSTEGYAGAMAKIASQLNILEEGNARARGSFHKMTAALASFAFVS